MCISRSAKRRWKLRRWCWRSPHLSIWPQSWNRSRASWGSDCPSGRRRECRWRSATISPSLPADQAQAKVPFWKRWWRRTVSYTLTALSLWPPLQERPAAAWQRPPESTTPRPSTACCASMVKTAEGGKGSRWKLTCSSWTNAPWWICGWRISSFPG